jgi:hypothetical protein
MTADPAGFGGGTALAPIWFAELTIASRSIHTAYRLAGSSSKVKRFRAMITNSGDISA